MKSLSHVQLFSTPWTIAYQAPSSMGFSRQEYWSGLPFPSPGDLPHPGIKPGSPALQADTLTSEPAGKSYNYQYISRIDLHNIQCISRTNLSYNLLTTFPYSLAYFWQPSVCSLFLWLWVFVCLFVLAMLRGAWRIFNFPAEDWMHAPCIGSSES